MYYVAASEDELNAQKYRDILKRNPIQPQPLYELAMLIGKGKIAAQASDFIKGSIPATPLLQKLELLRVNVMSADALCEIANLIKSGLITGDDEWYPVSEGKPKTEQEKILSFCRRAVAVDEHHVLARWTLSKALPPAEQVA
jgi:hypothetical protein